MPRPPKPRLVEFMPNVTYFKPAGVPLSVLDEVCLGVDELEALRLKDLEGLEQEDCAKRMNLAQSTFQRILVAAREKLTRAIVEGKAIRIEGGHYRLVTRRYVCAECGRRWEVEETAPGKDEAEAGEEEAPRQCPVCGSPNIMPQWHRGRGRGGRFHGPPDGCRRF